MTVRRYGSFPSCPPPPSVPRSGPASLATSVKTNVERRLSVQRYFSQPFPTALSLPPPNGTSYGYAIGIHQNPVFHYAPIGPAAAPAAAPRRQRSSLCPSLEERPLSVCGSTGFPSNHSSSSSSHRIVFRRTSSFPEITFKGHQLQLADDEFQRGKPGWGQVETIPAVGSSRLKYVTSYIKI